MSFVGDPDAPLNLWGTTARADQPPIDRIQIVNQACKPSGEITDFTLESVTWTWKRGPDNANFSVSPLHPSIQNFPVRQRGVEVFITTATGETWWGFPSGVSDGSPSSMSFSCLGLMDLLANRYIDRTSLLFTSVATGTLMSQLVNHAQSEEFQAHRFENIWPRVVDLGFNPEQGWTHILRSRKYKRDQHQNILDLLAEFGNLDKPVICDIGWDGAQAGTNRKRYMNITAWYEEVFPLAFPLVFSIGTDGSNIQNFGGYQEAGEDVANDIYMTGGTSGNVRFEAHYTDDDAASERGLQTAIVSAGDVLDPDWLMSRARREAWERRDPEVSFDLQFITVPAGIGPLIAPGSIWPIHIYCGRIQVHGNFRIISKTYRPGRGYQVKVQAVRSVLPTWSPFFEWGSGVAA